MVTLNQSSSLEGTLQAAASTTVGLPSVGVAISVAAAGPSSPPALSSDASSPVHSPWPPAQALSSPHTGASAEVQSNALAHSTHSKFTHAGVGALHASLIWHSASTTV